MDALTPNPDLYHLPFSFDDFNGMPYRALGDSGLRTSAIGLGTWKFGYPETGDQSRTDEATAFKILDRAYEQGVTFWDTANRYNSSSGNSERIIGKWFRLHPECRRDIVLATKIRGGMDGHTPNHAGLSRANILDAVYACVERLQVEHIDLLYFHQPDDRTPVDESLGAIEDLVREDLVRYFAVSNFTVAQLEEYADVGLDFGRRCRVIAVQNRYDMLNGEMAERQGVLAYCAEHDISYVPYSPLAGGLLSDRYLDPAQSKAGDRLFDESRLDQAQAAATQKALRRLRDLALAWGIQLSQLALAYTMQLPGMGPPIPGATCIAQLDSNATAGKLQLNEEQLANIRVVLAAR